MLHVYMSLSSVMFFRFSVPWSQNLILYTALFISYLCAYYVNYIFCKNWCSDIYYKWTLHQTRLQILIVRSWHQILMKIFQLIVMVKVKSLRLKKSCIDALSNNLFLRIWNMIYILRFLKGGLLLYHDLAFMLTISLHFSWFQWMHKQSVRKNTRCGPILLIIYHLANFWGTILKKE